MVATVSASWFLLLRGQARLRIWGLFWFALFFVEIFLWGYLRADSLGRLRGGGAPWQCWCVHGPQTTAPPVLCSFPVLSQIQTEAAFCAPTRLSSFYGSAKSSYKADRAVIFKAIYPSHHKAAELTTLFLHPFFFFFTIKCPLKRSPCTGFC